MRLASWLNVSFGLPRHAASKAGTLMTGTSTSVPDSFLGSTSFSRCWQQSGPSGSSPWMAPSIQSTLPGFVPLMTTTGISSGVPPARVVTGIAPIAFSPGAAVAVPTVTAATPGAALDACFAMAQIPFTDWYCFSSSGV